jgi:molecular chaperone DnaK (HSP70)
MSYQLGIDFGTTFTAAVLCRAGEPEVVDLGAGRAAVPSVLHLGADGAVTVGEAAPLLSDPERTVRAPKRRIGDPAPVVLGGEPWPAEDLAARLVRWVVDRAAEQAGGPAARIALAHPATWGAHTLERLAAALAGQGLGVTFLPEAQAAVVAHAAGAPPRAGAALAVYDLGGGRFDAAVVRRGPGGGFRLLGRPEGLDVGGLDLDDLLLAHVTTLSNVPAEPDGALRRACIAVKEALSADAEATVRAGGTAVTLRRGEFEEMIAPLVGRTVGVLRRVVESAGLAPADLAGVLLAGGSSRIPLVARTVEAQLGCPVVLPADPQFAVARGAALAVTGTTDETRPALVSTASGYLAVPDVAATLALPVAQAATLPSGTKAVGSSAAATVRIRARMPAVLDLGAPGRPRSLARRLAGAGIVLAALLMLVALFRPDGPLDPPLDPSVGDAGRPTGIPAAAVPPSGPSPLDGDGRSGVAVTTDGAGTSGSAVDTTPPSVPDGPVADDVAPRPVAVRTATATGLVRTPAPPSPAPLA